MARIYLSLYTHMDFFPPDSPFIRIHRFLESLSSSALWRVKSTLNRDCPTLLRQNVDIAVESLYGNVNSFPSSAEIRGAPML